MKKIVILSGAGMSAESGFSTFRDAGGLWERYPVEQVATPEGWAADPDLVTDFYNGLRRQLADATPNAGHRDVARLEERYEVVVVTQNVDDLHERAGSSHVIHLHGELMQVCSSREPENPQFVRTLRRDELSVPHGAKAGDGSLLRPRIVWFGEAVPLIETAAEHVAEADAMVIIGTGLSVYPAAGLVRYVQPGKPVFLVDPKPVHVPGHLNVVTVAQPASTGVAEVARRLEEIFPAFPAGE